MNAFVVIAKMLTASWIIATLAFIAVVLVQAHTRRDTHMSADIIAFRPRRRSESIMPDQPAPKVRSSRRERGLTFVWTLIIVALCFYAAALLVERF